MDNTTNILTESLYNLTFFNRLYRYIISEYSGVTIKSGESFQAEITRYFPEQLIVLKDKNGVPRKTHKVIFDYNYSTKRKSSKPLCFYSDKGEIVIQINAAVTFDKLINNLESPTFKDMLRHEVIHAMDMLRSTEALEDEDVDVDKKSKSKHHQSKQAETSNYWKDEYEMNQFIHTMARYKTQWPTKYSKITNLDDIFDIMDSPKYGLTAYKSTKSMRNDPKLRKEILKRLARENLLPLGLRSKI